MLAAKEQAFIDLHTQHSARVFAYIACRISDRHRAEELAADVFRIPWQKAAVRTARHWLAVGNVTECDRQSVQGPASRRNLSSGSKTRPAAKTRGRNTEERGAVAEVLMQLRERDRGVLVLSYSGRADHR